jgi:REP element-mobilizing transposase RayT
MMEAEKASEMLGYCSILMQLVTQADFIVTQQSGKPLHIHMCIIMPPV